MFGGGLSRLTMYKNVLKNWRTKMTPESMEQKFEL